MTCVLFEVKDHEDPLDASLLYQIVERLVERIQEDHPLRYLKHQICIIVAAKCNIVIGKKFKEVAALFDGSMYLLGGTCANLSFECLHYQNGSGRICFIIPGEEVLEANFHPFRGKKSSVHYTALAKRAREDLGKEVETIPELL
jgi:hypothetical protein